MTHEDFGFPDERTFSLAMNCGPVLRFEIRKAAGDLKTAQARIEYAQTIAQSEREIALHETSKTRFIDKWVQWHKEAVHRCELKLRFLRDALRDNF